MSELTPCNYCTLQRYRRQYGEDRVTTRVAGAGDPKWQVGWTVIQVDGRDTGCSLQVVTDHCVC